MSIKFSSITLWVVLIVISALLMVIFRQTRHLYYGDEPHYLIMADSIIRDGDLDLAKDYELQRYRSYFGGEIEPHLSAGRLPEGTPARYSLHGYGMGFLITPLMSALARFGEEINPIGADITMALVASVILFLLYFWARRVTGNNLGAMISVAILLTSNFFLGMFGFIYPDLVLTGCALAALILLDGRPTPLRWLMLGVVFAIAPWFHFKAIVLLSGLGLWAIIAAWRAATVCFQRIVLLAAFLVPIIGSLIGMSFAFHTWYNIWIPSQVYSTTPLGAVSLLVSIPGMLFDATKGLFVYNPALWLVIAGLPIAYRYARRQLFMILAVSVPAFVMTAFFNDWHGGFAPTGRYLMEFIPVIIPLAGLLVVQNLSSVTVWLVSFILIFWHGLLGYLSIFSPDIISPAGRSVFDLGDPNPIAGKLVDFTGIDLAKIAPHFGKFGRIGGGRWSLVYGAIGVLLFYWGAWLAYRRSRS